MKWQKKYGFILGGVVIFVRVLTVLIRKMKNRQKIFVYIISKNGYKKKARKKMDNKECPSYDCGYCVTSPTPYDEKCENLNCKWKEYDFKKENVTKLHEIM